MALALCNSALGFAPASLAAGASMRADVRMESKADLQAMAVKLNPVVGFWDPLNLAEADFWEQGNEATIGWLREAEIKHGRVAMAAFVGFIVHSNGIRLPWDGIATSVPKDVQGAAVWDAIPEVAQWQIIVFVGVMELWRENSVVLAGDGEKHYMRGGKPGYFPSFDMVPHSTPYTLFDPFNLSTNASEEKKAKGRLAEINNGRLAQIGIMAFLSESQLPGSVPFLKGVVAPYSGECMAPFMRNVFDYAQPGTPFM